MQNLVERRESTWRLSHTSRLTPLPFLRIPVLHAYNMNIYDYERMGRHREETGDSIMGGDEFKTKLIFIKICSFGLGFHMTLPLPMRLQVNQ